MALKEDLTAWVNQTFSSGWEVQNTTTVPNAEDLRLNSNHAKDLETATVLYADLDGSTSMVNGMKWEFSAEIYKTFLKCASDIIKNQGGTITAYDGDRVMAIFTGGLKNTSAAKAALNINYACTQIIQPAISKGWKTDFILKHVVGIDTSQMRTSRIGVRGDNDLVWIGRAANYAAKLTDWNGKPTRITSDVYEMLKDDAKYSNGVNMWTPEHWVDMNMTTYSSTWHWGI